MAQRPDPPTCTCNGLRRPHPPGVRWCTNPTARRLPDPEPAPPTRKRGRRSAPERPPQRPPEPVAPTAGPRPRVGLELAAGHASWHVRLGVPWLGVRPPATMGLVYEKDGAWQGRYYVAQSPDPSVPVPPSPTRAEAVAKVVDAWVAHVPVLGRFNTDTDP